PACGGESRTGCHVLQRAIAPIPVKMIGWLLPFRKSLERCAVHLEDVDPAIAVVIECRHSGAGGFEQIGVRTLFAVNGAGRQSGFRRDVGECESEVGVGQKVWITPECFERDRHSCSQEAAAESQQPGASSQEPGATHCTFFRCSITTSVKGPVALETVAIVTRRN